MNALTRRLLLALGVIALMACTVSTEARGCRRSSWSTVCSPSYCWPSDHCCSYHVSLPVVDFGGPYPTLVRDAVVGSGVIVQFNVHLIPPFPTDKIEVTQKGKGVMRYAGWSKHVVNPCLLGSPTRYSIYLCPLSPGDCQVEVKVYLSDGTDKVVPFTFNIRSYCHSCYGRASNPCTGPGEPRSIRCWLPSCPSHVPGTYWGLDLRHGCWRYLHVFALETHEGHTTASAGESTPMAATSPPKERATLVVTVPRDAKVYFDDQATSTTGEERTFKTLPLTPDGTYSFTVKAEVVRDGKTFVTHEQIQFRAGETAKIALEVGPRAVAAR